MIFTPLISQEHSTASEIIIKTIDLAPFEKIRVTRGINVTLEEGESPKAEIHIQNADPDDVLIDQSGTELKIRMRPRIYRDMAVNVYLYYQNIKEISTGSGASVFSDDLIIAEELILNAGTDSSIQFELETKHLTASASAGRIDVYGSADILDANITTGARFLGYDLNTQKAVVRTSTGAMAQIRVNDKLEAKALSGSKIEYTGRPEAIEIKTNLGGSVREAD